MKSSKFTAVFVALLMSISSLTIAQEISSELDSISYTVGILFAKNIKQQGISRLNPEKVAEAINDYMTGATTVIPEAQCQEMYRAYMEKVQKNRMESAKSEGLQYLAENAKRPGVTVTESGLQYEVINTGKGDRKPSLTDEVETHYHGTTVDGTVFDSSVERGEPISFPVNGVIKGWTEALQMMSVGDKYRLVIPSELAYGARGAGAKIPPHATLIFEVELLGIK